MYREEGALLPALLQSPVAPQRPLGIDRGSLEPDHPMLQFIPQHAAAPLGGMFTRYFATTGRTPEARVLANFSSGDAFLLESPFGRGRVILVTCSLRPEWSTLPLTPVYLPLVQSMVRYVASSHGPDRNLPGGAEVVARYEPEVNEPRATVVRPDRSRTTIELVSSDGRSEARYAATDLAGIHTVRAGPRGAERSVLFSVAPPAEESDLTPLDEPAWTRLQEQLGVTLMEPASGTRSLASRLIRTREDGAARDQYWLAALAGVLGLFVVELTLARFWSATSSGVAA